MGACISIHEDTLRIEVGAEARERRRERRRWVMEMLLAEAKAAELLADIPRRMCRNGQGSASSCLFTRQGRKGINQDCMLVWEDYTQEKTVLCGVFDGHGPNGHLVAKKVRDTLPSLLALPLESLMNKAGQSDGNAHESHHTDEPECCHSSAADCSVGCAWQQKLVASYKQMDENLKKHPTLNCTCSGTTAVMAIMQEKALVVANVGDSRAILGRRAQDGSMFADQLTVDLKPNLPGELERIKECKGRVFALDDEPDVARLWLPNGDTPGLAMARALGDFILKDYGLSRVPQVSHRNLTEQDEFIVLATDGVWDVLSNEEVVELVSSAHSKQEAAKLVVDAATKRWKVKLGGYATDDCAVVCHFFKDKLTPIIIKEETCHNKKPKATTNSILGSLALANKVDKESKNGRKKSLHRGETFRGIVNYDSCLMEKGLSPMEKFDRGV